ncbi:MAG: hypothetical protein PHY09_16390 [Desulfuromonadaceae bacterium]|nr:hypothetical protein [Desulfuromonadaceae bacterium]MDD5106426.1 hypothetical protein [Desulfuromonadaceae bacterium]
MVNDKNHSKVKCLLMGIDGVTYQALLWEISLTGALIKMGAGVKHGLNVGEMCGLALCASPKRSSAKHTGRIVELDPSGSVGITFHHQEHQHKKKKYTT